jgi:Rrf2 family iron-sulfur cluster assembly transcriptional regulator
VFRINRRTDYSVRVMLSLAKRPFGTRLATQVIQDEMLIPRPFLQRIIADLSKAELIVTYPGVNGGIQLAHPAEKVNLRQIWEAIEGPLLISDCLKSRDECPLGRGCPVRSRWARLQMMIAQEMEATRLDELANEANALALVSSLSPSKFTSCTVASQSQL